MNKKCVESTESIEFGSYSAHSKNNYCGVENEAPGIIQGMAIKNQKVMSGHKTLSKVESDSSSLPSKLLAEAPLIKWGLKWGFSGYPDGLRACNSLIL